jgi:hypothetical protein
VRQGRAALLAASFWDRQHRIKSMQAASMQTDTPMESPAGGYYVRPREPERYSTLRLTELTHNYHLHPLMQLPALERLANNLFPLGMCKFMQPGTTQATPFTHQPRDFQNRSIAEIFRDIEQPGSWIALYHVERDPAYRDFLDGIIDGVRSIVEPEQPGIFIIHGFIFISAPPSATPFHIDRENNFWLQIRGRKLLTAWDHTDRDIVAQRDVEEFIVHGDLKNVVLKDGYLERGHRWDVGPGDGVYFPSTSPHTTRSDTDWVKPGDGVSISIGVNFYTAHTRRAANVHALNRMLRRFGLNPREPGASNKVDAVKYPLARALVWGQKTFRGFRPKSGV